MSDFNFSFNGSAVPTNTPRLKPWAMYKVKFKGCRIETIQGKKDPTATYTMLKIRFENEQGHYEESVFFPKPGDEIRKTGENKTTGHKYELPSPFERSMQIISQLGEILNPDGFKTMQEASKKFRSFDDVCNFIIKITDKVIDTEVNLKLVGRPNKDGVVEACLPKICSINSEGKLWASDTFIGNKIAWSAYELQQIDEYNKNKNAKPTSMPNSAISGSEDLAGINDLTGIKPSEIGDANIEAMLNGNNL